jgi:hypothetical protein
VFLQTYTLRWLGITSAIASIAYPSCGCDLFGAAGILEGLMHTILSRQCSKLLFIRSFREAALSSDQKFDNIDIAEKQKVFAPSPKRG